MISIDPKEISVSKLHRYLLGSIGPRPIAFASTIDKKGSRNLAPFSFFNVFSANPPVLIFSPARSGRTNTNKDTYFNVKEVPEVVINVVTYAMVQQMSLASSPFDKDTDEFVKTGFTPIESETISPYRVLESPIQFECKVIDIRELGSNGGAGNLIFCEVNRMHINKFVIDQDGLIDQQKIDLVSRMGGNWYCRSDKNSMFEVDKPIATIGIGVDALPDNIRLSNDLTGNDLGKIGSMQRIPSSNEEMELLSNYEGDCTFENAKKLLESNNVSLAFAILNQLNQ
jgi:flavin reductase (DIM6/NTAB) family NADH-FMN oxidoreductase RutF